MQEREEMCVLFLGWKDPLEKDMATHCSILAWKMLWTEEPGVLFIIGNWNAEVGSQEILGVTGKFGLGVQNEAGQKLFCQENALVIAITLFQQHKRRLYTWTSPDGQY